MSAPTFPRWEMHEVKDWQQLYVANENGTEELNLVTPTLINYTMIIGVNNIDQARGPHFLRTRR